MSDIEIHGAGLSTCTRRLLFTSALLNLPIKLVEVDVMKGQHKTPEHLKYQPFGKIPYLKHGDFHFYESRAICRYLNDVSETHALIPQDLQGKALFEQWASLEYGTFNDPIANICVAKVFYKFRPGGQEDPELAQKNHEKLKPALEILDQQLSQHPYICGENISLVDVWILPMLWALSEHSPEDAKQIVESTPAISAWWKRVTQTPQWQAIVSNKHP
jgi:glutathione S-transferase